MLQSSEELNFTRVAEALIVEGPRVARARVDARDDLAQVLHVVVADLGSALHDHGGEDDGVHLAIWDPEGVLLAAEIFEQLVAETGVELVAEGCGLQLLVGVVLVVTVLGEAHGIFGFATDVTVLVALEKACGGFGQLQSIVLAKVWMSETAGASLRQICKEEDKNSHIPQRPMLR